MSVLTVAAAVIVVMCAIGLIVGLLMVDYKDERAHRQQMVRGQGRPHG